MSGRSSAPALLLGIARLAGFRADGWELIPGTRQAFLRSVPPLLALPVLSGLWSTLRGGAMSIGPIDLLAALVAALAPAVLSEALARRWGREAGWLRYAVAFNWCQFAVVLGGSALVSLAIGTAADGPPRASAAGYALLATALYALVLQWSLARGGLDLGRLRAVAFTLFVNAGTGLLVFGPTLIAEGAAR